MRFGHLGRTEICTRQIRDAREARTGPNIRTNRCRSQGSASQRQNTRQTAASRRDRPAGPFTKSACRNRSAKNREEYRIPAGYSQCNLDQIPNGLLILLPHTREHKEHSRISGPPARRHAQVFDIRKACIWVLTCESHIRSYRRCDSSHPRSFRKDLSYSFPQFSHFGATELKDRA